MTIMREYLLLATSVASALLMGGIVFGFPALENNLLVKEKAFASLCLGLHADSPCQKQREYSALVVSVATSAVALSAFPSGMLLDYVGPRITACAGSFVFGMGLLALSMAHLVSDLLYMLGFVALAFGGMGASASMTNFTDIFPAYSSTMVSLQTGAFQASSIVFLLWTEASRKLGLSFSQICVLYMGIPALIFLVSFFAFPDKAFGSGETSGSRGEPDRVWRIRRILSGQDISGTDQETGKPPLLSLPEKEPLASPLLLTAGAPFREPPELYNVHVQSQICSVPFVAVTFLLGFFSLALNFFLSTVGDQLLREAELVGYAGDRAAEVAAMAAQMLSPMLSIGGVLGIPLLSFVLTSFGVVTTLLLQGVIMLAFLLCTLPAVMPFRWKFLGFFALGLNRSVTFGASTAYIAQIFGFRNFGVVFGLSQLAGALFAPVQYVLPWFVASVMGGSYLAVNLAFLAVQLAMVLTIPRYLKHFIFSGFWVRPVLSEGHELQ